MSIIEEYQLTGKLKLKLYEGIKSIGKIDNGFELRTTKGTYKAKKIVLSTGFMISLIFLNVPGEELDKVLHYYKEPHTFFGMNVVVVGAANSAVDVALELYRKGAKSVTMIIREEEIGQNVKYWARPDINNRIKEGSIKAYFKTEVKEITNDKIIIETPKKKINIKNDFVLAMTGYKPNFELLESLGVEFEEDDFRTPVYDSKTMQSNQTGVFLAGVVCGGLKTNKWFIENSRDHAKIIMKNIKKTQ